MFSQQESASPTGMMNRIAGLETEFGCLVADESGSSREAWPLRIKNHIFRKQKLGLLDLHYRDYEEPPGNGGFLLNGGRIYLDMGHLEYASPECADLRDVVAYDLAGDLILQGALDEMGVNDRVSIIKNNIDHQTGATFGCHENYLMKRNMQFTPAILGTLLSFLATRQIFTGAGRVGQANVFPFETEPSSRAEQIDFQISQRADYIVNDIYQWVQFNRAIINARDEPLADHRRFRRLHLLVGDSNISPFAAALKVGTTTCLLTLLEEDNLPRNVVLEDAVQATREISRDTSGRGLVRLEDGRTRDALDLQEEFQHHAQTQLAGRDAETEWILESWGFTLEALREKPESLIGGVDWISKKWLLDTFAEAENLSWQDPWLQSVDLEYHNLDPAKGLFFGLSPIGRIGAFNDTVRQPALTRLAPSNTRAKGRGVAVGRLQERKNVPYVINWESMATAPENHLLMPDPFVTYELEAAAFAGGG